MKDEIQLELLAAILSVGSGKPAEDFLPAAHKLIHAAKKYFDREIETARLQEDFAALTTSNTPSEKVR